ncbi:MAG: hypothetical protein ACE37F_19345 [Nannocystaceae bacterium]|nr:hypothetical protein [bacterium]
MKRRLCHLLGLSTLALGPFLPERAEAAPATYSIYCRGGQGATDLNVGNVGVVFQKLFLHAGTAYDADTLAPGTCAWPDRPMTPQEPHRLYYVHELGGRDFVSVRGDMQLGLWRAGQGMIAEQDTPANLDAVNKLQSENFIVELRVRSDAITRKLRRGEPRQVKILRIKEVGVVRQIGASNRG